MAPGQSDGQRQITPSESRRAYWGRVLRPLYWWLLLVLVLYGIRLHQRLSAGTIVKFTAIVRGEAFNPEGEYRLDGKPFLSGEIVRIGWHQLQIHLSDGYPVTTNLFVWYGENNLGQVTLERTKGTLVVHAIPPAARLTIRGPEFTTTLTNCGEFQSRVPTDRYSVEAAYTYWKDSETVPVSTDATASHIFKPRFGTIAVAASHPDISFELRNGKDEPVTSGRLPITITGLPEGSGYHLSATRKNDQKDVSFDVRVGTTNDLMVEFLYGTVDIQSDPAGATVIKDGHSLGVTPLTLPETKPGPFEFALRLDEYDPVDASLTVVANHTNEYSTNLISVHYTRAMTSARQFFQAMNYDRATAAATEALEHKPGDEAATNLLQQATVLGHLARAETLASQGNFTNAIAEANLALDLAPDNAHAKELVADYTNREKQRLEAIRQHEAELAEQARLKRERELAEQTAQQRMQELNEVFNQANSPYENANLFSVRELIGSNSVSVVAGNIQKTMGDSPIYFSNLRAVWLNDHMFVLTARQSVGVGYREFLMLGSQIRDNEARVRFKVYEYEHPPQVNLLGGLLKINTSVTATSQDPQAAAAHARQFQARINSGMDLASGIVRKALATP